MYAIIKVQVWGGTKKHPKIIDYDEVAGIVIGEWLYYDDGYRGVLKYKTTANKVEWIKKYGSYAELTKNHKKYKNTKKNFNKIIKEKVK